MDRKVLDACMLLSLNINIIAELQNCLTLVIAHRYSVGASVLEIAANSALLCVSDDLLS